MADEMVQVPRELVLRAIDTSNQQSVRDGLRACLPWEPPAEQVEAMCSLLGWSQHVANHEAARRHLHRLREQGFELRRREDV